MSMVGAFSLFGMIGMTALAVEGGNAYAVRADNQGVADAAALAGALSLMNNGNQSAALQSARDVALAASISSSSVTPTLISSPRNASFQAIKVDIATDQPLFLARIFGSAASMTIRSSAIAEIGRSNPACVMALNNSGTPVSLSTSSRINATDCSVASNGNVSVDVGSTISGVSVESGGSVSATVGSTITTTPFANNIRQNSAGVAKDPFAGNAALAAQFAKIGTAQAPAIAPTTSAPAAVAFPTLDSGVCITSCVVQGKTVTKSGGIWYFPASTYHFTNINVGTNQKIEFQGTTASPTNLYVQGNVSAPFTANLKIGDGNVYVGGDLTSSTNSNVTIGNGRHYFRSISSSVSSSIVIGNGDIDIQNVINGGAGVSISIGNGVKKIGGNVTGLVGTSIIFGTGQLNVGGSLQAGANGTLTIGTSTDHYINGNMEIAVSSTVNLGAARYYVGGYVGGAAGATYNGNGVSIFAGGPMNVIVGSAGLIRPPTADGTTSIDNIAFASLTTAASSIGAGATGGMVGVIYLPNSTLSVTVGSTVGLSSECLLLISSSVSFVSGGILNTRCSNLSSDFKTQTISLVG